MAQSPMKVWNKSTALKRNCLASLWQVYSVGSFSFVYTIDYPWQRHGNKAGPCSSTLFDVVIFLCQRAVFPCSACYYHQSWSLLVTQYSHPVWEEQEKGFIQIGVTCAMLSVHSAKKQALYQWVCSLSVHKERNCTRGSISWLNGIHVFPETENPPPLWAPSFSVSPPSPYKFVPDV